MQTPGASRAPIASLDCSRCAEDTHHGAPGVRWEPGRATRSARRRTGSRGHAARRCSPRRIPARREPLGVPPRARRMATSGDDSVRSRRIRGVRTDDTTPPTSAIGRPCGLLQEVTVLRERLPPSRSSGGLTRPRPPASPNEVENNEQIANRLTPPWVPSVPWFTAARSASLNRRAVELHRVLAPRAAFRNGALPIAATLWHCDRPRPPSSIAGGAGQPGATALARSSRRDRPAPPSQTRHLSRAKGRIRRRVAPDAGHTLLAFYRTGRSYLVDSKLGDPANPGQSASGAWHASAR